MWRKIIDDHWVSSVLVVFNNFLLIDATDRSKIRIDQMRFFIALSLYPFHFSRTLPLSKNKYFTSQATAAKHSITDIISLKTMLI